jgi:ribosomal protein L11 methylase PrmA
MNALHVKRQKTMIHITSSQLLLALTLVLFHPSTTSAFVLIPQPVSTSVGRTRSLSCAANKSNTTSQLTDWVIANLENDSSQITSSSTSRAGENDTLPPQGLCMAKVRILAADSPLPQEDDYYHIRLLVGRNGWGTGVHPTTRLCLEWLATAVQGGEVIFDYGCGSGILSIAALHYGASKCVGVDIEAEALVTAERNVELNHFDGRFEGLHTREILPYQFRTDICVANILIGQLVRPSMVSALVTNIVPGGLLCLSGIRPHQVASLKEAYREHVDEWVDYDELTATDTEGSIDSYGFDVGQWARLVGRIKLDDDRRGTIDTMSELAVS